MLRICHEDTRPRREQKTISFQDQDKNYHDLVSFVTSLAKPQLSLPRRKPGSEGWRPNVYGNISFNSANRFAATARRHKAKKTIGAINFVLIFVPSRLRGLISSMIKYLK
jgi:hypothetical protein